MAAQRDKIAPPLWVWAALALLVLLCTTLVYMYERLMRAREYPAKTAYLVQRCSERHNRPLILVLGSSMTQCALDSTGEMERQIGTICGQEPVLVKIWKPAARIEEMVASMPKLKEVHPDLLVVEANMLFYLPDPVPLDSRMYSAFNQLVRGRFREVYFPDVKPNRGMLEGNKDMAAYRQGLVDSTQLPDFRELARLYQHSGTRVVLINIPLQSHDEMRKWQSMDTSNFRRNLIYLQSAIQFEYLRPDVQIPDSCFIDKGHLNGQGTSIYSRWLVQALAKNLCRR